MLTTSLGRRIEAAYTASSSIILCSSASLVAFKYACLERCGGFIARGLALPALLAVFFEVLAFEPLPPDSINVQIEGCREDTVSFDGSGVGVCIGVLNRCRRGVITGG
jgi:hypothetical protein